MTVIRSPLSGWLGGKFRQSRKINSLIPSHKCYAEVFAGGAWILFTKQPDTSKAEIINDINQDVVGLYRVLQNHLEEFLRYFKWALVSRDEYLRLQRVDPSTLTDIQRAARFYYLQKTSFAGKVADNPSFGVRPLKPPLINLLRIEEELSQVHMRLTRVVIERLDYAEFIKRYDRDYTFFYLDPPYYGKEHYYGPGFERADFQRLRDLLASSQAQWLLSINDTPEIRQLFADFIIEPVQVRYSTGRSTTGGYPELLIRNYQPLNPQ